MARNPRKAYGKSLRCWDDATNDFATTTGIEVVAQAAYHRITNEVVLGPGGADYGEDVRKWAGMDAAKLARRGPVLSEVLQRDPRIDSADVRVEPTNIKGTLWSARITMVCTTALGPFRRVFSLQQVTTEEAVLRLESES